MDWFTVFLGWLNPFEWIKKYFRQRRESKKLLIYKLLEQTGPTPPSLTVKQICEATGLREAEIESLLYEMIREGTLREGLFSKTFTRYLNVEQPGGE